MKFIKNFFKLNTWKRYLILAFTIAAAIAAIITGSLFYTSKNTKLSPEYGNSAEYVFKVNSNDQNLNLDNVAQDIYSRIDNLGVVGISVQPEFSGNDKRVRIIYPELSTKSDIDRVQTEISDKPKIVITDIWGNPIFTPNGNFDETRLNSSTSGPVRAINTLDYDNDTYTPLKENGATPTYQLNNFQVVNKVQVSFSADKVTQLTNATRYVSSLAEGNKKLLIWSNLADFVRLLKNTPGSTVGKTVWDEAGNDPYRAAHVNNNIKAPLRNGDNYLISNASDFLIADINVTSAINNGNLILDANYTTNQAINIAKSINYSASNYSLESVSTSQVNPTYGNSAFRNALISLLVVFSVIALFLIINYGLLGALATISIALFVFITITLFTVMRGEYSPEALAALIIGIGLSVNAAIIKLERLKIEVYSGNKLLKASSIATRKTWLTVIDSNVTNLIIAIALFYFGQQTIAGFSVILMLSSLFSFVVFTIFTQFLSTLLVQLGVFDNRLNWLGIKPKIDPKIQGVINKINFVKSSKFLMIFSGLIILAGVVSLIVFWSTDGSFSNVFNLGQDFRRNGVYQFNVNPTGDNTQDAAEKLLIASGFKLNELDYGYTNGVVSSVKVVTNHQAPLASLEPTQLSTNWGNNYSFSLTSSALANKLINNALIAMGISFAGIFIYILFRFNWTYSVAAVIGLIHDLLIIASIFIFARLEISPVFFAALLAVFGYSINDTIVTFDRIREKTKVHVTNFTTANIRSIANNAIADTFKRSIYIILLAIIFFAIFMGFSGGSDLVFNITMVVGLIFGVYSSIFISCYIWVGLEALRQKGIARRDKNKFWHVAKIEEQLVQGINDYTP